MSLQSTSDPLANAAALRLADTYFFEEDYITAERSYKRYIDQANDDPHFYGMDYAYFRLAQAQWLQKGETFFLVPPDDRKDQTQVKKAFETARKFRRLFPDSPYWLEVAKLYERISRIRMSYNLEVARFYLSRKKPEAAVMRLQYLLGEVPLSRDDPEVLRLYVRALRLTGNIRLVAQICERYVAILKETKWCELQ